MKHILLALFLITSTAHGALTKVPQSMQNGVVAIRAYKNSQQLIPNNTALTTVTSWTASLVDTCSPACFNLSTGVFTPSQKGLYRISAAFLLESALWSTGNISQLSITRSSVGLGSLAVYLHRNTIEAGGTFYLWTGGTDLVALNAGDQLTVQLSHNRASGGLNNYNDATWNYVAIEKIGDL